MMRCNISKCSEWPIAIYKSTNPSETLDLLRVVTQRRCQSSRSVSLFIEMSDVMPDDGAEVQGSQLSGKGLRLGRQGDLLNVDGGGSQDGYDKVPESVSIGLVTKFVTGKREIVHGLSKDDSQSGVDGPRTDRSDESRNITPFPLPVELVTSFGEVEYTVKLVVVASLSIFSLSSGQDLARNTLTGTLAVQVRHRLFLRRSRLNAFHVGRLRSGSVVGIRVVLDDGLFLYLLLQPLSLYHTVVRTLHLDERVMVTLLDD
jgi:hypothetical protein